MTEENLAPSLSLPDDHFRVASPARTWNYLMGGKDNFEVDRKVGEAMADAYPRIFHQVMEVRRYLLRAVRHVAEDGGVRQFLDIGCGLPAPLESRNTHDVAQEVHPDAKVVYCDNDKAVLAHARALLTPATEAGTCAYIDSDARAIEHLLGEAGTILDFTEPVGVILFGLLGSVPYDDALRIAHRAMAAVPPGSYLLFDDGVGVTAQRREATRRRGSAGVRYHLRSPEEIMRYFDGLELLEPGLVPVNRWRPGRSAIGTPPVEEYGAVARKPRRPALEHR